MKHINIYILIVFICLFTSCQYADKKESNNSNIVELEEKYKHDTLFADYSTDISPEKLKEMRKYPPTYTMYIDGKSYVEFEVILNDSLEWSYNNYDNNSNVLNTVDLHYDHDFILNEDTNNDVLFKNILDLYKKKYGEYKDEVYKEKKTFNDWQYPYESLYQYNVTHFVTFLNTSKVSIRYLVFGPEMKMNNLPNKLSIEKHSLEISYKSKKYLDFYAPKSKEEIEKEIEKESREIKRRQEQVRKDI